ncbi:MAG: PLDc N-terminal domain-containing protein [Micrococcaceae bacterium]
MTRIVLLGIVLLFVAAVVDWALSEKTQVRTFGKVAWFFMLIVPVAGPVLWTIAGRPSAKAIERGIAPDDDENFLNNIKIDQELRKRKKDDGN